MLVERTAPVGEDLVELSFLFSNPGNQPITILHLVPSCGCTIATVEKNIVGRGETGRILVLFDAKGRSGLQEKTVQVFTDQSPKPTVLTLRLTIPPWLEIKPRLLFWPVGEKTAPKQALIAVDERVPIKLTAIAVDDARMQAVLEDGKEAGTYLLIVTPITTTKPVQTLVHIKAELADSAPRSYSLFAQVR